MTLTVLDQHLTYALHWNLHLGNALKMHFLQGNVWIDCAFAEELYRFSSFYFSFSLVCFTYLLQLYLTLFERGELLRTCEQSNSFWKIFMLKDNPEFPGEEHSECCEFLAAIVCICNCVLWGGGICVVTFAPVPGMCWASFCCAETKEQLFGG